MMADHAIIHPTSKQSPNFLQENLCLPARAPFRGKAWELARTWVGSFLPLTLISGLWSEILVLFFVFLGTTTYPFDQTIVLEKAHNAN